MSSLSHQQQGNIVYVVGLEIHAVGPQQWGDTVELEVTWTSGSMIIAKCYNSDSASGTECGDFSFDEVLNPLLKLIVTKSIYVYNR